MELTQEVERAIDLCYDAALAPELWTYALDRLAWSLGAEACMALPFEPKQRPMRPALPASSSEMSRFHDAWTRNSEWVADVYVPRSVPLIRAGHGAIIQSQLFSEDEIAASAFHQEITHPLRFYHGASINFAVGGQPWWLCMFSRSEPYTQADLPKLATLSPHFRRIVGMAVKTADMNVCTEVAALEKVGCAAILVNGRGTVTRMNRLADALIGPDFYIRNGKPWISDGPSQKQLEHLLAAIQSTTRGVSDRLEPVVLARAGVPWLLIEVMPVTSLGSDFFVGGRAILAISDLSRSRVPDHASLMRIFGLTAAEARIAAAVASGDELDTAAMKFGVSRETLRSQLKGAFAKTGCSRQSELVALVSRIKFSAWN